MNQIRFAIGDVGKINFSDYQLLEQYNAGNKILRKMVLDQFPAMLITTDTGSTTGQSTMITKKVLRLDDVRIAGRKVSKINISSVKDKTFTGSPTNYYLSNLSTINWYPIPVEQQQYEVSYIPESTTMDETMDSGYPAEIEALLVQFVYSKITGAEQDVTANWYQEINNLMGNIDPETAIVEGYY